MQRTDIEKPRSWNRLYANQGDGTFLEVTTEAGVRTEKVGSGTGNVGAKFAASWADYDNDGDPDLLIGLAGPEVLFRNNGDGTFTDVGEEAGLKINNPFANLDFNSSALFWDPDVDGDLDLFISSWRGNNRFYRNRGDGTFADISSPTGMDVNVNSWMGMPFDVNVDGLPDLYVANDFGPNFLYENRGDMSFRRKEGEYRLEDAGDSMGAALGDLDRDGRLDLFITNNIFIKDGQFPNTLFMSQSDGSFNEMAADYKVDDADWAWGTEMFDYDLDGDLDLFIVNGHRARPNTKNRLYKNRLMEDGVFSFEDVSKESDTDGRAESYGLVVFDLDNDGDLDMLVTNRGGPVYMYRNDSDPGNWLKVMLKGVEANRDGLGARVTVRTPTLTLIQENNMTDYMGQSQQPLHFGLGPDTTIDEIEVVWPGGKRELWTSFEGNQTLTLEEQSGVLVATEDVGVLPESFNPDVHPNPSNESFTVRWSSLLVSTVSVSLHDMLGRLVRSDSWSTIPGQPARHTMNVADLAQGAYVLRFRDPETGLQTSRIVTVVR